MRHRDDLWQFDESVTEDPSELLSTIPEIRRSIAPPHRDDEDMGLRSLLERPLDQSKAWWRNAKLRRRRHARKARHQPNVLRAA